MKTPWLVLLFLVIGTLGWAQGEPPYPRIANLYGAGLSWKTSAQGLAYWKKLGLIVGGGSDWHMDYGSAETLASHRRAQAAARLVRSQNPTVRILPYFDVIEGPDNPGLPKGFWLRDSAGNRVSTWPGFFRVDTKNPAVLDLTRAAVVQRAFGDPGWDGAFLDCWEPDAFLVPALRAAGPDRLVVTNSGSFPRTVSPLVNGALSEDELDLVAAGKLAFADLMDRYRRWNAQSARPAVSVVSAYPRTIDPDPWRWARKTPAERQRIVDEGRDADPAMMRFGLTFTLMGEGYFAYDGGTQVRGGDWWYPEFDAPLGRPLGPARALAPDVWGREFETASVRVNGSDYDETVHFDGPRKDASTGRVARDFVLPRFDGRIFLVTTEAPNAVPADEARFTRSGVDHAVRQVGADGRARWQFPGGLEVFFSSTGLLEKVHWKGQLVLRGGYPDLWLKDWKPTEAHPLAPTVSPDPAAVGPTAAWTGRTAWKASTAEGGDLLADRWSLAVTTRPDGSASLVVEDDFEALARFDLAMWRHFVFLPVEAWKGRPVTLADDPSGATRALDLPLVLGATDLGPGRILTAQGEGYRLTVRSNLGFGLVDHRRYDTQDFLWAGYPVSGTVTPGTKARVRLEVEISPSGDGGGPGTASRTPGP